MRRNKKLSPLKETKKKMRPITRDTFLSLLNRAAKPLPGKLSPKHS